MTHISQEVTSPILCISESVTYDSGRIKKKNKKNSSNDHGRREDGLYVYNNNNNGIKINTFCD